MSDLFRRASLLAALVSTLVPAGAVHAAPCWRPPVAAPVADPFRKPPCAWCPGNRGIEYRTQEGAPVTAVAAEPHPAPRPRPREFPQIR